MVCHIHWFTYIPQCRIYASMNCVRIGLYNINLTVGINLQWDSNQNNKFFIHGNASAIIVSDMAAILSRGDRLIGCWHQIILWEICKCYGWSYPYSLYGKDICSHWLKHYPFVVFHEEDFCTAVPSHCRWIVHNTSIFLCLSVGIQQKIVNWVISFHKFTVWLVNM